MQLEPRIRSRVSKNQQILGEVRRRGQGLANGPPIGEFHGASSENTIALKASTGKGFLEFVENKTRTCFSPESPRAFAIKFVSKF